METDFTFYPSDMKKIKKIFIKNKNKDKDKNKKGGKKNNIKINIKNKILKFFYEILNFHETLGKKGNISTRYRIDSYRKAIKSLESFNDPIYSCDDVKALPNIGKGFCEKIDEISKTGTLKIYENIQKNNTIKSIQLFQSIWGFGPGIAHKLVNKKIYTINQLKKNILKKKIELTEQQLLGLKYYDDLSKKIPRDEITEYTKQIKKLLETDNIKIYNAGSYRAGKKESGDIDLILTYKSSNIMKIHKFFYETLLKNNIIKETLSHGIKKSMYIVKLQQYKYYRKIDIAFIEEKYLPWYLLYFGSSRDFSKKIRAIASKLGYKLNEKGLYDKKTGKRINFNPKEEKEIFDFLNIDYVIPENRV